MKPKNICGSSLKAKDLSANAVENAVLDGFS